MNCQQIAQFRYLVVRLLDKLAQSLGYFGLVQNLLQQNVLSTIIKMQYHVTLSRGKQESGQIHRRGEVVGIGKTEKSFRAGKAFSVEK